MERFKKYLKKHPPLILAISFLALILVGSILLSLPISQKVEGISYIDCLFTATSAVCVTGLVTLPTVSARTAFGKVIIIILIQMGGLGFMTFTTLVSLILRKKISFGERVIIKEQTNSFQLSGMVKLIKYILLCTFVIEFVGAVFLMIRFVPKFGLKGIPISLFHSISAFCNAGFDILNTNSLIPFNQDKLILIVLGTLVFLGGLGFVVYSDLFRSKFRIKKCELHTKVVLFTTFSLIAISSLIFFFLEGNNPSTLKGFSFADKLVNSIFQAITLRTAGFAAIDQAALRDASAGVGILNMFIGGSPASTAGGIKTTTFAVLIILIISDIHNRQDVEVFNRRINIKLVRKAVTITLLALSRISVISILIMISTNKAFLDVLYEVASAFGTVGVSRNVTPSLNIFSKILIILTMYVGRTGLITVLIAMNVNARKKLFREAEENIIIG